MARASSRNMSSSLRPLSEMWDGDGRIRSFGQRPGDIGQPRQRAASGAAVRMNSSPSTTSPGTQSPSQPQRALPGVRNFSLFGGAYTWKQTQEEADLKDPNFNRSVGGNVLKQAVVAGKPAVTSGSGWDPSMTGEDYGAAATEMSSVGAGNPALAAAANKSAVSLTRTGEPITFTPSSRGVGIETSGAGVGALFGQKALPEGDYYVPTSKPYMADTPGMAAVDIGGSRKSPGVHPLFDVSFKKKRVSASVGPEVNDGDWFSKLEWKPLPGVT